MWRWRGKFVQWGWLRPHLFHAEQVELDFQRATARDWVGAMRWTGAESVCPCGADELTDSLYDNPGQNFRKVDQPGTPGAASYAHPVPRSELTTR